jgi:DNA-binding NarL/FixJ family response regulator
MCCCSCGAWKDASPDMLVDCIRRVHRGEQWIERETVTRAFKTVLERDSARAEAQAALTPREIEIVKMVATGCATGRSARSSGSARAP